MSWQFLDNIVLNITPVDLDLMENMPLVIVTQPRYYGTLFSKRGKILVDKRDFQGAINAFSMAIVYSYDEKFLASMLLNRAQAYLMKDTQGRLVFIFLYI